MKYNFGRLLLALLTFRHSLFTHITCLFSTWPGVEKLVAMALIFSASAWLQRPQQQDFLERSKQPWIAKGEQVEQLITNAFTWERRSSCTYTKISCGVTLKRFALASLHFQHLCALSSKSNYHQLISILPKSPPSVPHPSGPQAGTNSGASARRDAADKAAAEALALAVPAFASWAVEKCQKVSFGSYDICIFK